MLTASAPGRPSCVKTHVRVLIYTPLPARAPLPRRYAADPNPKGDAEADDASEHPPHAERVGRDRRQHHAGQGNRPRSGLTPTWSGVSGGGKQVSGTIIGARSCARRGAVAAGGPKRS